MADNICTCSNYLKNLNGIFLAMTSVAPKMAIPVGVRASMEAPARSTTIHHPARTQEVHLY